MFVRKQQSGSTSTGHTWDRDGQIVEIPDSVAVDLLAIPDGGFTEVPRDDLPDGWDTDPDDTGEDDDQDEDDGDETGQQPEKVTEPGPAETVTEPAPAAETGKTPVDETPAKPARKTAAAKAVKE